MSIYGSDPSKSEALAALIISGGFLFIQFIVSTRVKGMKMEDLVFVLTTAAAVIKIWYTCKAGVESLSAVEPQDTKGSG